MPNWCMNSLRVTGKKIDVATFVIKATGPDPAGHTGKLTYHAFIPMPPNVFRGNIGSKEEEEHPGEENWYGWSIKHWGVKWDACEPQMELTTNPDDDDAPAEVCFNFDSPWGPPNEVVDVMAKQHPTLHFVHKWCEPGMDFSGLRSYEDGKVVEEVEGSCSELRDITLELVGDIWDEEDTEEMSEEHEEEEENG